MFGFNCCRNALNWVYPDGSTPAVSAGYAIRDDLILNNWNDPFYLSPTPPNAFRGRYAYNNPLAPFKPDGSPNFPSGLQVDLGMRRAVYSGSAEVQEFATGNYNGELKAFPYNYITCRFSTIAQGTPIASAQLVLSRATTIGEPPIAIHAIARVWDTAGFGTITSSSYPWPTNSYGTPSPSLLGIPFLPEHPFAVTGTTITVDITSDVQAIINKPGWSPLGNCYVIVLVFTVYPQAQLWVNNIHPGGNFPNYPASNTAVWFTDFDPTVGAFVRIAV